MGQLCTGTTDILEGRGGDSPPYICSEEEECVEDGIYLAQRIETVWAPPILSSPHTASNHSPLSLWAERDSLQCGGGRAHTCTVQEPRRAGRPGRGAPRPEGGPEEEEVIVIITYYCVDPSLPPCLHHCHCQWILVSMEIVYKQDALKAASLRHPGSTCVSMYRAMLDGRCFSNCGCKQN